MLKALSVDLGNLFISPTVNSCIYSFISNSIMKRFSVAQRVKIVSNYYQSHECMVHTLKALESCNIGQISQSEIRDIVSLFEATGSVHDNISYESTKKRKASEDTTDTFYSFEPQQQNHAKMAKLSSSFMKDGDYVVVYTDGACENNGKPSAKAGIGVWFGDNHPMNVSRPVVGRATNNTAEIQACVIALEILHREGVEKVKLKTDSQFTISCITQWIKKWKKNNWKLSTGGDVKNKTDLIKLDDIQNKMVHVDWNIVQRVLFQVHVRGHAGEKGNEEADKLARNGALLYKKN